MSSLTLFSTAVITALWLCVFLHIWLIYCSHWMLKSLSHWARLIRSVFMLTHVIRSSMSTSWTFYTTIKKLDWQQSQLRMFWVHDEMQALFHTILLLLFQNYLSCRPHPMPSLWISMKFKSTLLSHLVQQLKLTSLWMRF